MAIFAGNLYCKLPLPLHKLHHSQPLLIRWLKKQNFVSCSEGKSESFSGSSVPVRYIPKNPPKPKESQTISPRAENSKAKEVGESSGSSLISPKMTNDRQVAQRSFVTDKSSRVLNQNKNQMLKSKPIFNFEHDLEEKINSMMGFEETEFMEEPEEVVDEYKLKQDDNRKQPHRTIEDAEKLAVELLAARAFTALELQKKLLQKKIPLNVAEEVINDFRQRGLINDFLYAETFSRSRWSSLSWGPRRIKQALQKKGVSRVDIDKAVKLVFEDGDSDEDQESRPGLSKLSMDQLFVQASKQWLRSHNMTNEIRKSRIIRWLQYRGFNWEVINAILKKLESQYPP
ncbi:Regulatory protein RecX [Dillenia turbinata]|uniref:Regulatory protein RecX n=1 Tax=Dillenia turbinata TaxID=194707 RepID=A0AAN8WIF8_9MAGN